MIDEVAPVPLLYVDCYSSFDEFLFFFEVFLFAFALPIRAIVPLAMDFMSDCEVLAGMFELFPTENFEH
jgi:hypothetical protein